MSQQTEAAFVAALYKISKHTPELWKEFLVAFNAHVSDSCEAACQAPLDNAILAHGRAQSLMALRTTFNEVEERYTRAQTKQKSR